MHKSKEGKVIASLTEVKNKTGDIFALVDEFGEVVLTSYNKARYRILKIGVAEMLEDRSEKAPTKKVVKKVATVKKTVAPVSPVIKITSEPKVIVKAEEALIKVSVLEKLKKMSIWDRNSKKEKNFVSKIKQPLQ